MKTDKLRKKLRKSHITARIKAIFILLVLCAFIGCADENLRRPAKEPDQQSIEREAFDL